MRSGEGAACQLLEALICSEQPSRFPTGESQIETVVHRVIEVTGQRQRFDLQMAVGFDHIHQLCSPAQALLQPFGRQLAGPLQTPQGVRHLGEHQLRRQHEISVQDSLLERRRLVTPLNDAHHG